MTAHDSGTHTRSVVSAVAPKPGPSITRGLGLLAGIAAAAAIGLGEATMVLVRTPPGTLSFRSKLLVIFHCAAVLSSFGLFIGAAQELLLAAARRRPFLVAFGEWAIGGPRRWFARNPKATLALMSATVYAALVVGPILPVSYYVVRHFHSHFLGASAIFLFLLGMVFVAALIVLVLAWPLGWLFERIGRVASPGAALVFIVLACTAQTVRFLRINAEMFRAVDGSPAVMAGAALVADLVVLLVAGRRAHTKGRPPRPRIVVTVFAVAFVAFAISGVTFGARQTVASTVFQRSTLTGPLVRVLQHAIDLDGDHYGALFGGGDCNDHNARIHPGAHDIPGNGIDENCTGADARIEQESGDGRMATVVGPLARIHPSFVLLSVDAMRPDHIGAYGYSRPTTPNIDRFARESAQFIHAYCTSPRTIRSFSSVWTGKYPSQIAWTDDNQGSVLLPENVTLTEQLDDAGYLTVGFNNGDYLWRTQGFLQGFSEFHELRGEWKADINTEVNDIVGYLTQHDNDTHPFFLWAHMMEPHDPYRHWGPPHDFGNAPMDNYDAEIARADDAIGRVLETVDHVASHRPVIVMIISDHGEAFGEHGYFNHSTDLHEEQARVALMIRGPGITPGPRKALASLMDLNPTILNYAGRPEERPVVARSLVPVLQNPDMPFVGGPWRDHLFMEVMPDGVVPNEQQGLLQPPYKLIYDVQRGLYQMYDLARDPSENHNLVDDDPQRAARLTERLMSWVDVAGLSSNRSDDVIAAARMTRPPDHMDVRLNARFGDVAEVLGCNLPTPQVHLQGTFQITCFIRALRQTSAPYWFRIMFQPDDNADVPHFGAPHFPIAGRYPTTRWIAGEIIRDPVSLWVEPEVRPTGYSIRLRLEEDNRWQPIPVTGPSIDGTTIVLGHLDVLP